MLVKIVIPNQYNTFLTPYCPQIRYNTRYEYPDS